jgi:hypothetical protein
MNRVDGVYYINLNDSVEGNAFGIMGIARRWSKQLGMTDPTPVMMGAKSYRDLLDRFDEAFQHRLPYEFQNDPRKVEEEVCDDDF